MEEELQTSYLALGSADAQSSKAIPLSVLNNAGAYEIPLIPNAATETTSKDEHMNKDDKNLESSLRAESSTKWKVLACLCFVWTSLYHCILSIGSLEDILLTQYNLSNSTFSLLSSTVFFTAIIACLLAPYFVEKTNVYKTLIFGQMSVTMGQIFTSLACYLVYANNKTSFSTFYIIILFFGRGLIGFSLGIADVAVNSICTLYFGASPFASTAFLILASTLELGIITARYGLVPIATMHTKLVTNSDGESTKLFAIYSSFWVGVGISLISVFSCYLAYYYEKQFVKKHLSVVNQSSIQFDRRLSLIREFDGKIWIIIILITIGFANIETWVTQMSEPLVAKFGCNETQSDLILSTVCVMAFVFNPIWAIITRKFGLLKEFAVLSMALMVISMMIDVFAAHSDNCVRNWAVWSGVLLYIFGTELFFASLFPLLYANTDLKLVSVVNSVNATLYLLSGVLQTYLFGIAADVNDGYGWSMMSLAVTALFGFVLALVFKYNF